MNNLPPDEDDAEVDALYRRMAAADPSEPGERVRQAVLAHATGQARQAADADVVRRAERWQRHRRAWGRPTAFGALAAGILAAFMLGPRFLTQPQVAVPMATKERAAAAPPVLADLATAPQTPAEVIEPDVKIRPESRPAPQRQPKVPASVAAATTNTEVAAAPAGPRPATGASGQVNSARAAMDAAPAALAGPAATVSPGVARAKLVDDSGPALWRAAETGDLAVLRELHEKQVNLDAVDATGRTALLIATLHGHSQAVTALLEFGADPNIPDASGESPLDAALAADESEIIAALKRHGAR